MRRGRTCRWARMRRPVARSSDMGLSPLCRFCQGSIIATRGYDFREGQVFALLALANLYLARGRLVSV